MAAPRQPVEIHGQVFAVTSDGALLESEVRLFVDSLYQRIEALEADNAALQARAGHVESLERLAQATVIKAEELAKEIEAQARARADEYLLEYETELVERRRRIERDAAAQAAATTEQMLRLRTALETTLRALGDALQGAGFSTADLLPEGEVGYQSSAGAPTAAAPVDAPAEWLADDVGEDSGQGNTYFGPPPAGFPDVVPDAEGGEAASKGPSALLDDTPPSRVVRAHSMDVVPPLVDELVPAESPPSATGADTAEHTRLKPGTATSVRAQVSPTVDNRPAAAREGLSGPTDALPTAARDVPVAASAAPAAVADPEPQPSDPTLTDDAPARAAGHPRPKPAAVPPPEPVAEAEPAEAPPAPAARAEPQPAPPKPVAEARPAPAPPPATVPAADEDFPSGELETAELRATPLQNRRAALAARLSGLRSRPPRSSLPPRPPAPDEPPTQ
jgi:hypothetical protein